MICRNPNCEMENPDNIEYCRYCGRRLRAPEKNNSKLPMQILAGIAALVVLVIGARAVFGGNGKPNANQPQNQGQVVQQAQGYKFAFVRNAGAASEVYVNNADGTVAKVTNSNAVNQFPSFSPDGTKIAFERKNGNSTDIYVMNANGTGEKKLASGHEPTWTSDGSKIVFYSKSPTSDSNVLNYIRPDGTGLETPELPPHSYFMSRYSPDGTKIALSRKDTLGWQIIITDMTLGHTRILSEKQSEEKHPAWSPDSAKLAYDVQKDNNEDIFVVDMNKNETRLTTSPFREFAPSWTPDGKIMFTREENGVMNIYSIDADGNNEKLILNDAAYPSVSRK